MSTLVTELNIIHKNKNLFDLDGEYVSIFDGTSELYEVKEESKNE